MDEKTGKRLTDMILDEAKQKGTGMRTSQDAMDLQVPLPNDRRGGGDAKSVRLKKRTRSRRHSVRPAGLQVFGNRGAFLTQLRDALYAATVLTYAQGMAQLRKASQASAYDLELESVARIWRGDCIIRATLLEPRSARPRSGASRRPR